MQSWQTDLVNTYLSLTVKPALRHVSSLRAIRAAISLVDSTAGRLAVPGKISIEISELRTKNCRLAWVKPTGAPSGCHRVVLYLPGGAYVMRTPNLHNALAARICLAANASALMCYYRLAPENPFPAGLEDALETYDLLLQQGHKPENIAIAGDSAGGGLALSLLLAIRDSGRAAPACAVLMSPLLDAGERAPSRVKNSATDAALPHPSHRGINPRNLYVGNNDLKDPLISPVNGNFKDLPPIYILVSDSEMLLDDSLRFARRANIFRTRVRVDIWRKVPHVWVSLPFLPESKDGLQRIASFLNAEIPGPTERRRA